MMQNSVTELKNITYVTAGHPIRGAVEEKASGDVFVVQLKNVRGDAGVDWSSVVRTTLEGRREPDWLRSGDVIFSARGYRNVAVLIEDPPARVICSPHFFLLRVKKPGTILPEFLAWQINLPEAQRYFAQSAEGSNVPSIRRQVLEALPLQLPSLERQRTFAQLGRAARREKEILEHLIKNRERELDLVARDLLA